MFANLKEGGVCAFMIVPVEGDWNAEERANSPNPFTSPGAEDGKPLDCFTWVNQTQNLMRGASFNFSYYAVHVKETGEALKKAGFHKVEFYEPELERVDPEYKEIGSQLWKSATMRLAVGFK